MSKATGKLYCAVYVSMGRIVDKENGPADRSAFAELATALDLPRTSSRRTPT